jgi:small subunit ribosomal protein S1
MDNENMEDNEFARMLDEHEKQAEQGSAIIKGVIVKIDDAFVYVDVGRKNEARIKIEEFKDKDENLTHKIDDDIDIVYSNNIPSFKKADGIKKVKAFIEKVNNDEVDNIIEVVIERKIKSGFIVNYEDMSFFMPMSLAYLKKDKDHTGSKFKVKIIKCDTEKFNIIVSRKDYLDIRKENFQKLVDNIEIGDVVDATITNLSNYTVGLDVDGVNSIIKFNEISHKGNINPSRIYKIGDVIKAKVIDKEVSRETLILSSKQTKDNPWDNIDKLYNVGDIVKATVISMKDYGIFVALNEEIDGFVHISELSWNKEKNAPSDFVEIDKEYSFKIMEIKKDESNIKLSLRETQEKPIERFQKLYQINDIVDAKVVAIKNFGAFLQVDFLDCILPNSKSSWDRTKKCSDLMEVGETVKVKIADIDVARSKVILDKKALLESPLNMFRKKYKQNDIIKGIVKNAPDFGIFIDSGDGVDVFISNNELYPKKSDDYKKGDEIEAVLTRITDKVSASIKQLERQRERNDLNESMAEFNNDNDSFTFMDAVKRKSNRK